MIISYEQPTKLLLISLVMVGPYDLLEVMVHVGNDMVPTKRTIIHDVTRTLRDGVTSRVLVLVNVDGRIFHYL